MIVARHHGVDLTLDSIKHEHALEKTDPPSPQALRLMSSHGFKTDLKTFSWSDILQLGEAFPVIAPLKEGRVCIILGGLRKKESDEEFLEIVETSQMPMDRKRISREDFLELWEGKVYLLKRTHKLSDDEQPFSLRWFIPEFLRQKSVFTDIAVAAVLMQILALATPLYLQILIDKVMVHHGISTLHMLGFGMLGVLLFTAGFTWLRGYLMLHATNKIDIRVAMKTFTKLLNLPMQFFDTASSGTLIKHMQQADTIRQFLSGRLFFSILDTLSLFIFLPVLMFYSIKLAMVVLLFTVLIGLVVAAIIPRYRKRLQELYNAEGKRQSFLVEAIQGMQTVKSLALESQQRKSWEEKAANAVQMNFKVGRISVSANALTGTLEKLMTLTILWWGVYSVFNGEMSVGELIAFNMLAGRVSAPLVQIVSLINDYQETALSVKMLGEIMNRPPERPVGQRGLSRQIRGGIGFEKVNFSYSPTGNPPALIDINLDIPAGTCVGIVGRSGSGKSTMSKLLQGLYSSQAGVVRIDGLDIREIDLPHLRRNIGVVLQENFLFRGSVRENISMTRPSATFEEIVRSANLAGADEFIERLPQGYDTLLEEGGANLSGGQRQRLAIARALLVEPPILILDEATSALDAESEAIIQENLERITQGRTTIIISHRLSMITRAHTILVMDQGRIVANASHKELLVNCDIYANLWKRQHRD
ncbi:MAG: peptidase domain-containing ABC transporter [Pseudodesulfovibrio sp.]|nr:peptidase domain-containing ABC transporter [Pseudodesulfovibrio sp.]